MKVEYRQLFSKDLKKLKKQPVYKQVYDIAFYALPNVQSIQEIPNIKAMVGSPGRYRVRIGKYRIGFSFDGEVIELLRVLHRKDFYRYFP